MENISPDLLEITLELDNSLQLTHIWGSPCSIPVLLLLSSCRDGANVEGPMGFTLKWAPGIRCAFAMPLWKVNDPLTLLTVINNASPFVPPSPLNWTLLWLFHKDMLIIIIYIAIKPCKFCQELPSHCDRWCTNTAQSHPEGLAGQLNLSQKKRKNCSSFLPPAKALCLLGTFLLSLHLHLSPHPPTLHSPPGAFGSRSPNGFKLVNQPPLTRPWEL